MSEADAHSLSSFLGKTAIITGSTQGLGEKIAETLVQRGLTNLVVTGRNRERGESVAARFQALGCRTVFVPADLSDTAQLKAITDTCDAEFGRVDILVNAAGNTERGTILDTDAATFDRIFDTNVKAPFFIMQNSLAMMIRDGVAGSVLNVISMSGHGGQSFLSAYSASKGALVTLTRNTGFSVLRYGLRVNGLCIGWMYSPGEEETMRRWHGVQDGWREAAEARLPIGRMLDMGEVARTVAFLCSSESGMMTGSIIDYDQSMPGCFDAVPQPPMIPIGIRTSPPVD
ncbi:SDR family oxidoreductase [Neorhizobium sp. CSC1952]|uniref:SDR family oxidoreductase n=1 Tax=Neorhizobium sp. CSC1952 TaxID=2978974 RepID=UPI0025A4EFBD|nr:SDR family oxidoreductase [Rhizobium sp. CSC1952]WJR65017.1 SDR family oxidoreductase [Rhizobium sp. CSC1952]